MEILEGKASDILKDWVDGRYRVYYNIGEDGIPTQIEFYEEETDLTFTPSDEVEYYLEIIL